jgi:hypothetical protein
VKQEIEKCQALKSARTPKQNNKLSKGLKMNVQFNFKRRCIIVLRIVVQVVIIAKQVSGARSLLKQKSNHLSYFAGSGF